MDKYILDGQYGKYLEMTGVHIGEALKAAGAPEDLFSRKKPVLEEDVYYRFMDAVGSQIKDLKLPIRIASAENIESFSPPIFAAYCSKNTKICLERLARHKRIIAPMRYRIRETADTMVLEIAAGDEALTIPEFLAETEMVFVIHIIRTATKQDIRPLHVRMQRAVTDEAFQTFTGCQTEPSDTNELVFRLSDMEIPFISYNESMWEFFEPELKKRLYEMDVDDSMAARVRSALTELLPGDPGQLTMSPKSSGSASGHCKES